MEDVPVVHIEDAIYAYGRSPSSLSQWRAVPWLWEKLPWASKILGFLGSTTTTWWKERYVLPLMVEASLPHLQRFLSGDWQKREEEALTNIARFFSTVSPEHLPLFSSQILDFVRTSPPSFHAQKQRTERRLQHSQLGSTSCLWFRDETFAQYCSRMNAISQKTTRVKVPEEKIGVAVSEEQVRPETKEKGLRLLRMLEALRDESTKLLSSVKESVTRSFPLRQECGTVVLSLQELQEEILTLLIAIEGTMTKTAEPCSGHEKEVIQIFKSVERAEKNFSTTLASIQSRAQKLFSQIESARTSLHQKLQHITVSLDHVPVLPASSTFRPHQTRLFRSARDLIKRFRQALSKGPGPVMSLDRLEKEVLTLSELARAFYKEGVEVEKISMHLLHFEQVLRSKLQNADDKALQALLTEVEALRWTLEVSSDRSQEFERIAKAFSASVQEE